MAKILIVEDDQPISELLRRNLTLVGHACIQACSGEEALKAYEADAFDLVLLDLMLPKLSGMEVLKRISAPRYHTHRARRAYRARAGFKPGRG